MCALHETNEGEGGRNKRNKPESGTRQVKLIFFIFTYFYLYSAAPHEKLFLRTESMQNALLRHGPVEVDLFHFFSQQLFYSSLTRLSKLHTIVCLKRQPSTLQHNRHQRRLPVLYCRSRSRGCSVTCQHIYVDQQRLQMQS